MALSTVDNGTKITLSVRTSNDIPNVYTDFTDLSSLSWEETVAEIDVSSKASGGNFQGLPGQKKTTLSLSNFVVLSDVALTEIENRIRTRQTILIRRQFNGSDQEQGIAFITSFSRTGGVEDAATAETSMTLQGGWGELNDIFTADNTAVTADTNLVTADNAI